MDILIDRIRIKNFRALKDVEVALRPITIMVGANNSGKTTLLRALNSVLGIARNHINQDDLFVGGDGARPSNEIMIDIRIVPADGQGNRINEFDAKWGNKLGTGIQVGNEKEFFAFRTKYSFTTEDTPTTSYHLFANWENEQLIADESKPFSVNQIRNNLKMYFIDAQRDIMEDSQQRTSFFGRLVSQLDYGEKLEELKGMIDELNETATENSSVLKHLKEELKKLNQTTRTKGEGVSLNPFPKKITDLHKGMKVYFQDSQSDTFSMENHGMGTRSWASIITAGAFSSWQIQQIEKKIEKGEETDLLFPVFALEEPEAHLHPNAQRTLYKQLKGFRGQKIVSTHSPYIAGQAELEELRHFYKEGAESIVSEILFDQFERENIVKLERLIETEGKTPEAYKKYSPLINELRKNAEGKLTEGDKTDLIKEIFLNKGEILFSKALLLFEGFTEEVSLPIFYQKLFNRHPYEDGITLLGVSGKKNYSPFLKFAKYFKIPVFILSDGDGNTADEVKNQIKRVYGTTVDFPLFILPSQADFEKFLIDSGYEEEIKSAIDSVKAKKDYLSEYIQDLDGQKGAKGIIRDYKGDVGAVRALLDCMRENKTDFTEKIVLKIVESGKPLPVQITELFKKIADYLKLKDGI